MNRSSLWWWDWEDAFKILVNREDAFKIVITREFFIWESRAVLMIYTCSHEWTSVRTTEPQEKNWVGKWRLFHHIIYVHVQRHKAFSLSGQVGGSLTQDCKGQKEIQKNKNKKTKIRVQGSTWAIGMPPLWRWEGGSGWVEGQGV